MSLNSDSAGLPKYFGYNYFGPGNPYPNGSPRGPADVVAQGHDKFYDDILKASDWLSASDYRGKVNEADAVAIQQFVQEFRNGDISSGFGAAALSIKTAVERVLGHVIYPAQSSVAGNYAEYN